MPGPQRNEIGERFSPGIASYVFQGSATDITVRDCLCWLLESDKTKKCILTSAYMDGYGVSLVLDNLIGLKEGNAFIRIYVGIDNGVTTYEAIKMLVDAGICVTGIDTANIDTIFHQKAYATSATGCKRMVIGSSNLTGRGLLRNYEGVVLLENGTDDGEDYADELENALETLRKEWPDNFVDFHSIDHLHSEKDLLVTAKQRALRLREQLAESSKKGRQNVRPAMPPATRGARKNVQGEVNCSPSFQLAVDATSSGSDDLSSDEYELFELIWTTKATKRHLNISSDITHGTGDFNLGKGKSGGYVHDCDLDFQTFYRYGLFDQCDWVSCGDTTGNERTDCRFLVLFNDVNMGIHRLTISYTVAQATRNQKNATTAIKWGEELGTLVKEGDYLGGEISLYSAITEESDCRFAIVLNSPSDD